jgi:spore germination protein Q
MYWNVPYVSASSFGWDANQIAQQQRMRVYTEDLLSRNIGKLITVYLTFENNTQWNAKIVTGVLRGVGRDFLLIRDQQTGKDTILMNVNIDYYVFENQPARLAQEDGGAG